MIYHTTPHGRSLLEAESVWWRDSIVRPCFVWSVNVFIIFCFLTRVLVYGEPVADVKSSSWTLFLNTKSAADRYIQRGNYNEAARQLRECLRVHLLQVDITFALRHLILNKIPRGSAFRERLQRGVIYAFGYPLRCYNVTQNPFRLSLIVLYVIITSVSRKKGLLKF